MARITSARLIGRREVGHDLFEYGIRFYDDNGAEINLGEGGQDIVIQTTDDLEEGATNLYFTDDRANNVVDGRLIEDVASKAELTAGLGAKAAVSYVDAQVADKATDAELAAAVSGLASSASVTSGLAGKRDKINQAKVAMDADTDFVEKFEVINDGTATSTWPNRAEYSCTPVGGGTGGASRVVQYLNEYFEWRGNARQNTVLWRAFVREFATDPAHDMATPIWEIQDDRTNRNAVHAMYGQGNFYHGGTGTVDGDLDVGGSVTADNIGVKIEGVYDSGSEPTGVPAGTIILVRP
jgi:hypothetical protein